MPYTECHCREHDTLYNKFYNAQIKSYTRYSLHIPVLIPALIQDNGYGYCGLECKRQDPHVKCGGVCIRKKCLKDNICNVICLLDQTVSLFGSLLLYFHHCHICLAITAAWPLCADTQPQHSNNLSSLNLNLHHMMTPSPALS